MQDEWVEELERALARPNPLLLHLPRKQSMGNSRTNAAPRPQRAHRANENTTWVTEGASGIAPPPPQPAGIVDAAINRIGQLAHRIAVAHEELRKNMDRSLGSQPETGSDESKVAHVADGSLHMLHALIGGLENSIEAFIDTARRANQL